MFLGEWRGTTVAVKRLILPAAMSNSERAQKMAIMEVAISSSMSHPHLVQASVSHPHLVQASVWKYVMCEQVYREHYLLPTCYLAGKSFPKVFSFLCDSSAECKYGSNNAFNPPHADLHLQHQANAR